MESRTTATRSDCVKLIRLVVKGLNILRWRLRRHGLGVTFTWAWTRIYLWTMGRPVLRYCPVTPHVYVCGQINARGWRWLAAPLGSGWARWGFSRSHACRTA